jgi:hypothetical protein
MRLGKTLSLKHRPICGSVGSTNRDDAHFIVINIDDILKKFVSDVDSNVDDLGYDVNAILSEYSGFAHGRSTDCFLPLADMLYRRRYVNNEMDAEFIAEKCMTYLYPEITDLIKGLGYLAGSVYMVNFKIAKSSRSVTCDVMFKVI